MHEEKKKICKKNFDKFFDCISLGGGGDAPRYEPVGLDDECESNSYNIQVEPLNYKRARVLCSYDAKDNSELNLVANEVSNDVRVSREILYQNLLVT